MSRLVIKRAKQAIEEGGYVLRYQYTRRLISYRRVSNSAADVNPPGLAGRRGMDADIEHLI